MQLLPRQLSFYSYLYKLMINNIINIKKHFTIKWRPLLFLFKVWSFGLEAFSRKDPKKTERAAVVHYDFRGGSTLLVPVCTVSPRHWVNKADTQ